MTRQNRNISSRLSNINPKTPAKPVIKRTVSSKESANEKDTPTIQNQVAAIKKLPKDTGTVDKLAEAEKEIKTVTTENRRLISLVDSVKKENDKYKSELESAKKYSRDLLEQYNLTEHHRLVAETELLDSKSEIKKLLVKLAEMERKASAGSTESVGSDQIGAILTDFEKALVASLTGFTLQNLELRLKTDLPAKNKPESFRLPMKNTTISADDLTGELIIRVRPDR